MIKDTESPDILSKFRYEKEMIHKTLTEFEKELTGLLNMHSMENGSDTPDFILAAYLTSCLQAYNHAIKTRETWYGTAVRPKSSANASAPTLS